MNNEFEPEAPDCARRGVTATCREFFYKVDMNIHMEGGDCRDHAGQKPAADSTAAMGLGDQE